jgi:hypothetical protein
MPDRHRQGAINRWYKIQCTCDMSNVRYVNNIKVALFRVTCDPFIEVASDWVST